MNKNRVWRNLVAILIFALFLGFTVNPNKFEPLETDVPVVTDVWNWMQESRVQLGLDLQGGTQLDYQIDLTDARARNADDNPDNDVDINQLLTGVKDVIERRVNSLGVSEPNIYLSSAGEEQHIVVELPGVEDIDDAKERVGKVVQLEFKTEKEEPTEEEAQAIEEEARTFFDELRQEESVDDLEAYSEDILISNQVEYLNEEEQFLDQIPEELRDAIQNTESGTFHNQLVRAKEVGQIVNQGQVYQPEGFNIVRVLETNTELRKSPRNAEDFYEVMEDLGLEPPADDDFSNPENFQPEDIALDVSILEAGEVTEVLDSEDGLYIVKMVNKVAQQDAEDDQEAIRAAHILMKTEVERPLREERPIQEIPEDASPEERERITALNESIVEENEQIVTENEEIAAENEAIKQRNEETRLKMEEILAEAKENPDRFAELAQEHSEDSTAENGGDLGFAAPSNFVKPFADAAVALEPGQITDELIETQFGYHIIKLIDRKQPGEERAVIASIRICYEGVANCDSTLTKEEAQEQANEVLRRVREETVYSYERVWFNAVPDPWQKTELDGRFFKRADVVYDQISFRPYVAISFDDKGAELFAQITEENINKRIGIFVGGEFISAPTVNEKITGGQAQITLGTANVQVALQQANELAQSLNAGSIPAPLKKPSELNIGASLGASALQKSLRAGALGLVLVAVFMLFWYRMLGLLAACSLIVYGLFLTFVIQSQVLPELAISLTFVMWIVFAMSLFRSKIDNIAKALFLAFSVGGVVFVFNVLINPIVLTLAGVAGLILSIGMAVDANILIFERIKEEFAQGKSFLAAVNDGFERAWSSILDSNVSSLITCAILFSFGTSIIKGFAMNLAAGIVISMFTAITVTKTFMFIFEGTKLERIKWLWKKK